VSGFNSKQSTRMEQLLTRKEVADALCVSSRTVARICNKGLLPFVKIGSQIRFRAQDVDAYISEFTVSGDRKGLV